LNKADGPNQKIRTQIQSFQSLYNATIVERDLFRDKANAFEDELLQNELKIQKLSQEIDDLHLQISEEYYRSSFYDLDPTPNFKNHTVSLETIESQRIKLEELLATNQNLTSQNSQLESIIYRQKIQIRDLQEQVDDFTSKLENNVHQNIFTEKEVQINLFNQRKKVTNKTKSTSRRIHQSDEDFEMPCSPKSFHPTISTEEEIDEIPTQEKFEHFVDIPIKTSVDSPHPIEHDDSNTYEEIPSKDFINSSVSLPYHNLSEESSQESEPISTDDDAFNPELIHLSEDSTDFNGFSIEKVPRIVHKSLVYKLKKRNQSYCFQLNQLAPIALATT
jgi:hypothetical protein